MVVTLYGNLKEYLDSVRQENIMDKKENKPNPMAEILAKKKAKQVFQVKQAGGKPVPKSGKGFGGAMIRRTGRGG